MLSKSVPRRCVSVESRSLIRYLKDDETIARITTVSGEGGISPIEPTSRVAFVKTDNGKIGEYKKSQEISEYLIQQ